MDAFNAVVQVPSWAYDFCWYYFVVAAIIAAYGVYAIYRVFTLPALVKKVVPVTTVVIALLLSGGLSVLLSLMQFWVCRSALRPAEKFAGHMAKKLGSGLAESFAVKCANDGDCAAVMGTQPAGSLCTCGARGFCAGCVMNNNMEPQASFSSDFAPIEGFASSGQTRLTPSYLLAGREGFATSMSPQLGKKAIVKPSKMPMRMAKK